MHVKGLLARSHPGRRGIPPGQKNTAFFYLVNSQPREHGNVVKSTILIPDYWLAYDYANIASDENLKTFFARYFGHEYQPKASPRHASGNRGYDHYCKTGEISEETQTRIEQSRNMEIYKEILESGKSG